MGGFEQSEGEARGERSRLSAFLVRVKRFPSVFVDAGFGNALSTRSILLEAVVDFFEKTAAGLATDTEDAGIPTDTEDAGIATDTEAAGIATDTEAELLAELEVGLAFGLEARGAEVAAALLVIEVEALEDVLLTGVLADFLRSSTIYACVFYRS